jgi:hypothetical protein
MGLRPTHGDESPWGWSSADPGFGSAVWPPRAADRKTRSALPRSQRLSRERSEEESAFKVKKKQIPRPARNDRQARVRDYSKLETGNWKLETRN